MSPLGRTAGILSVMLLVTVRTSFVLRFRGRQ
jgi:hypothetical protein